MMTEYLDWLALHLPPSPVCLHIHDVHTVRDSLCQLPLVVSNSRVDFWITGLLEMRVCFFAAGIYEFEAGDPFVFTTQINKQFRSIKVWLSSAVLIYWWSGYSVLCLGWEDGIDNNNNFNTFKIVTLSVLHYWCTLVICQSPLHYRPHVHLVM